MKKPTKEKLYLGGGQETLLAGKQCDGDCSSKSGTEARRGKRMKTRQLNNF